MSIKRIGSGARMSAGVVYNHMVFVSGQVAEKTIQTNVAEQTQEVLKKIDAILTEAGTDKTKVLSASIWLKDINTFAEMNSVWDKWVVEHHTPARATVEAKLAGPDYKVEIAVVAAL